MTELGDDVVTPSRAGRPATAPGAEEVVRAATRRYLKGEALDMSSLAAELGVGRATLYRKVGNQEKLIALVLAGRTAKTFDEVCETVGSRGLDRVLEIYERFLHAVVDTEPLRLLLARDPLQFIRVVMAPGPVEERSTQLFADLLEAERRASGLRFSVPGPSLALAMIRIGDSFIYSHLLANRPPEIDTAMTLVRQLLTSCHLRENAG